MPWWRSEKEWCVEDWRGREWRFRALEPDEIDFAKVPLDLAADPEEPITGLIDEGFGWAGAKDDRLASQLLAIYDRVTGRRRGEELPRPTNDPLGRLRGFRDELARALRTAHQMGVLTYERRPRPTFEFPLEEPEPQSAPLGAVLEEEVSHFLELQIVNAHGDAVAGIACDVTFSSAKTRRGTSGPDGVLRLSDVDEPGTAVVTLPAVRPFAPVDARGSSAGRLRIVRDGINADVDARTVIEVPPQVFRGRLIGMFFDTSKSFLLPQAMHGIRGVIRVLEEHEAAQLLVVGHTDTTGSAEYNLKLSIERAESVAAFLREDVDAWTAFFDSSIASEKRWGVREVQLMLSTLPEDASAKFFEAPFTGRKDKRTRDAIAAFQKARNASKGTTLSESGDLDDPTRAEIIRAYMELEGTSIPDSTVLKTHGCGEFHPAEDLGDGVEDAKNRRVEIFVFEDEITPAPVQCRSPGCSQYPRWLEQVVRTIDFTEDDVDAVLVGARLPSSFTPGRTFPKPAAIPMLREICARAGLDHDAGILIVGNTDDFEAAGQAEGLSRGRAAAVAAFLVGDAAFFRTRFDESDPTSKWAWPEIQWMLSAIEVVGDPCYAGLIDGARGDETQEAIERFQLQKKLKINRRLDEPTLSALIDAYLALLGDQRPRRDQVEIIAAGSAHAPRSFGLSSEPLSGPELAEDTQADRRRVEIFLSPHAFIPAANACRGATAGPCAAYETWCKLATEEINAPPSQTFLLRLTDAFTVPLAGASVAVDHHPPGEESAPAGTFSTTAFGVVRLNLPAGAYSIRTHAGDEEIRAAFLLDPHEGGGLTIRSSGVLPTTTP